MKDLDVFLEDALALEAGEKLAESSFGVVFEDSGNDFQGLNLEGLPFGDEKTYGDALDGTAASRPALGEETGCVAAAGDDIPLRRDTPLVQVAQNEGGRSVAHGKAESDHGDPGDDAIGQLGLRRLLPASPGQDRVVFLLVDRFLHCHPPFQKESLKALPSRNP